jgi:hypothetical protein
MDNKDLIKQYADTGLQIPDYQVEKLHGNILKTYIRKRLIAVDTEDFNYRLSEIEYQRLSDENKIVYLNILLDKVYKGKKGVMMLVMSGSGKSLAEWEFNEVGYYLGKEKQKEYLTWKIKKKDVIDEWEFNVLDYDEKLEYIHLLNDINSNIANYYKKLMMGEDTHLYESIKRYKDILGYGK